MTLHNIYETEQDAYNLISKFEYVLHTFGALTIADVIDIQMDDNPRLGVKPSYTDNRYGWIEANFSAKVHITKNGCVIELSKPVPLMW